MGRRNVMVFGFVAALGAAVMAQAPPRPTPVWTEKSAGNGPLDRLAFRAIGPGAPSGRVDDFAVLESDPATFYVGTATGGVYKTTNNGTTFTSVFDHEGSSSVGDLAIAPTDANLVWVGTGENNNRQSSSWGDGVYKSADGGRSWKNMGLRASKQIARIIVDPVDFNVVYVAALGDLWAAGGERGVYKTTDGGQNWQRVLHVDDDTGATELVMDPANNKTLYAATYQRRRAQWGMNGGGPGSTIWKSTDGGQNWAKADDGPARRREGPHRPGHLPQEPQRALRAHRASERERRLPYRRRRRQLAQAERRQSAADVLQPDSHRPPDRLAHLRPRRAVACVRRRRPHLSRRRRGADSRRSSRDVDQPCQPEPRDHRQRRRRQHHLRSLRDVGVAAQPAAGPGLSRGVRHAVALPRLRGAAGQQHVVRARAPSAPTAAFTTTIGTSSTAATGSSR